MFIDNAAVTINAGSGGSGIVSFRRERYVAYGGPDGGDGGKGGNVVFVASRNQNTLANFRYQKELIAEDGLAGQNANKHGKNGKDLLVQVPVGTLVYDAKNNILLADLTEDEQRVVIAKGGKGGFGNAHFTSSTRQAPKFAEKGEPGEEIFAKLELKMIADVGLVGLPNAGKSTFLASLSNARPAIANYPFTTLRPHLGIVQIDSENNLLVADIPGLIEGASEGKGLGDEFLRHIERTKVILHLVDAWSSDIAKDIATIQKELAAYSIDLAKKPIVVALTKIDGLDDDIVADQLKIAQKIVGKKATVFAIAAPSKKGTKELLYKLIKVVANEKQQQEQNIEAQLPVIGIKQDDLSWHIRKQNDEFYVVGSKIERFAKRAHTETEEGQKRLRDIMRKMGIMHALEKQGIMPEQLIHIGTVCTLEY